MSRFVIQQLHAYKWEDHLECMHKMFMLMVTSSWYSHGIEVHAGQLSQP